MTRRDVFHEVLAGLREIQAFEKGRKTLRTHRVTPKPLPDLSGEQIREMRNRLDVSRGVFAHQLRVSARIAAAMEWSILIALCWIISRILT